FETSIPRCVTPRRDILDMAGSSLRFVAPPADPIDERTTHVDQISADRSRPFHYRLTARSAAVDMLGSGSPTGLPHLRLAVDLLGGGGEDALGPFQVPRGYSGAASPVARVPDIYAPRGWWHGMVRPQPGGFNQ